MKLDKLSKQYAETLFNVATQFGSEKSVKDSLSLVKNTIKGSPEFKAFLLSKRISEAQKATAVQQIFGDRCDVIVSKFIGLIRDVNLTKLFQLLWKAYNAKFVEAMNIVEVTAHVSSNLSGEESAELKTSLESALGMSTELNVNVDPSLIGGIKLRVGNKFMDASIQNQLDKMRQSLLEA